MDYSSIASLPNLGPGSTGTDVKTLQDWLVKNGFLSATDLATGPGIYGPKTTAAVTKWQQTAGFDTQGNAGWFGPLSKSYITTQTAPKTTTPTTPTATTPTVSPQKALLGAIADVAQSAATTGKPPVSFADALDLAAKDPNIVSKYADMAKLDTQSFLQQVQAMQTQYGTEADKQKMQFENDRKSLAEQNAAAGTAYSGFRGKAQADLAKTESGIVTSTRSQQQQALNQLTSQFEGKYGTGSSQLASVSLANPLSGNTSVSGLNTTSDGTDTLTGQLAGGITGSVAPAKSADVLNSAYNSYQTAQFPAV